MPVQPRLLRKKHASVAILQQARIPHCQTPVLLNGVAGKPPSGWRFCEWTSTERASWRRRPMVSAEDSLSIRSQRHRPLKALNRWPALRERSRIPASRWNADGCRRRQAWTASCCSALDEERTGPNSGVRPARQASQRRGCQIEAGDSGRSHHQRNPRQQETGNRAAQVTQQASPFSTRRSTGGHRVTLSPGGFAESGCDT